MAGIYIHIPFCKSKCAYCDFYSVATFRQKDKLIESICNEIELQKNYFGNTSVNTIYFGGGTPSVLVADEIDKIINKLKKYFIVEKNPEITFEVNPDDLNSEYLKKLKNIGINRLSIGVQSFLDKDLVLMKRRHNSQKAINSIIIAQKVGFNNISVDLIYGLPKLSLKDWKYNLDTLFQLNIQHISAYHLTIEPKTLFNKWYNQNKFTLPTDLESLKQFELLLKETRRNGFIQYEISNFGLDGFFSNHNSGYWKNEKYLGIGPSAHSYNLTSRQWNISNITDYILSIGQGKIPNETEILTQRDMYNDYVLTSLRTIWGINLKLVENKFGKLYFNFLINNLDRLLEQKLVKHNKNTIALTKKGKFLADQVIRDLLFIEN